MNESYSILAIDKIISFVIIRSSMACAMEASEE